MASSRRDQILASAAELFAERGFHGVSVHDIGAACDISGPALYRHFAGKSAILTEMLVSISEELLAEGRRRAAEADSPELALRALVDWHIEFALRHPALIVVQEREWSNLPVEGRAAVRSLQLSYVDLWVDVVRRLRPDLDRPTARAAVQIGFGLLNSTPHSARISSAAMRSLLERMALAALLDQPLDQPLEAVG
ncbi:MAG TPA: TetR/AcrR family transcriptional regulator [Nocardioidaceae bacterium]|nr:TetR/AcrR family transcriptional regulator [Nocardioidaceae bacterium]